MVHYPKHKDIIEYNKKVLDIVRASKSDAHKVYSHDKIDKSLQAAKRARGDVEYKAAVLMKNLSQAHPFASGNKRTAYFSANKMIGMNRNYMLAKRREKQLIMTKKIREGRVSAKEIAEWLRK